MNITFMIGNGFDIGLGLATSFKEFFPIYYAKSLKKDASIRQLSENISDNEDAWSYFEKQLGEYTVKFDSTTASNFHSQLADFTKEFIEYLRAQEKRLSYSDTQLISKTLITALTGFYKGDILPTASAACFEKIFLNASGDEHRYNFISFNYTSALEHCLETLKDKVVTIRKSKSGTETKTDKIGSIVNVHGTEGSFPIMGVNDKTQIANKQLAETLSFSDRLVKPQINQRIRMNYAEQAASVLSSSKIICIYGMSLGITDRDWWDRVITWLHADSNRQLVIFNYDPQYSTDSPLNWLDKEDGIIDQLSAHNKNQSISVAKLRNRIHIAVHKNIFSMPLTAESDKLYNEALAQFQTT